MDGKIGDKTTNCIIKLQKKLGMETDGVISVELMKKLKGMREGNNASESVNYDMNNIKHLFGYNKKTQ